MYDRELPTKEDDITQPKNCMDIIFPSRERLAADTRAHGLGCASLIDWYIDYIDFVFVPSFMGAFGSIGAHVKEIYRALLETRTP